MPLGTPGVVGVTAALLVSAAGAQDWPNAGGNSQRNGLTSEVGPTGPDLLWSGGASSLISWQPVISGDRVFVVRQTNFVPSNVPNDSPVICYELDTGVELWRRSIPFDTGDWTTWIAGAADGKVYVGRSGNGSSVNDVLYALNETDGSTLWTSQDQVSAGFYDGVVFAPNGDLIVADFRNITRIDHTDGSTVWRVQRLCSVSGTCGGALLGDRIYVADAVFGGTEVVAFDLSSGAELYTSPVMTGFTVQQTPMVGPEGTVYLTRTQNNMATDFMYAFEDTGAALVERWNTAAAWITNSELAADQQGVYMLEPDLSVTKRAATDGTMLAQSAPLNFGTTRSPRMALDAAGKLYVSNGGFANGRLYALNADLSASWDVGVTNINIGGPAIGRDGTLIVGGNSTQFRAYRSEPAACLGDIADDFGTLGADGQVSFGDFLALLGLIGPCPGGTPGCTGDIADDFGTVGADGQVSFGDFLALLGVIGPCN